MKSKKRSFKGIADLVKTYRGRHPKKLSQVELSNMLGYKNGQFISNVERGICAIPLKALKDLKTILAIPKEDLVQAMVDDYKQTVLNHLDDFKDQVSAKREADHSSHQQFLD